MMITNYIKTALRNIARNKVFSVINLIGFAVGITVFLFIAMFVYKEYSVNRGMANNKHIHRLEVNDGHVHMSTAMGPELQNKYPEVKDYCRYQYKDKRKVMWDDKNYPLRGVYFMDSSFLKFFNIDFIQGDPHTAFDNPHSVILTQSVAQRIFGAANPINRVLKGAKGNDFIVSGVIEDLDNFYLNIRVIHPFKLLGAMKGEQFIKSHRLMQFPTFLSLEDETDPKALAKKISAFYNEKFQNMTQQEFSFSLRPFDEIYFASGIKFDFGASYGDLKTVRIFAITGIFILLLACFNFINLTTAKASTRAPEVGIRKTYGARKKDLVSQFLSESVLITFFSFLIALTLIQLLLPSYNNLIQADFTSQYLIQGRFIVFAIGSIVLIGTLAGIYPAFYLTRFQPIKVLKGENFRGKKAGSFRRFLVIVQFTIGVTLLIATLTVYKQLNYMKNKDLGINEEQVVAFHLKGALHSKKQAFKDRVVEIPEVEGAAYSFTYAEHGNWISGIDFTGDGKSTRINLLSVDPDYVEVHGLELVAGRNFSYETVTDQKSTIVLNEAALREIGYSREEAVGKRFRQNSSRNKLLPARQCKIIGVVKDFHFHSLHEQIGPLGLVWNDNFNGVMNVKLAGDNTHDALKKLEAVWQEYNPGPAFNYNFLSEAYDRLYKGEERLNKIFNYFATIAIIIAIMGLYGLSTFVAENKTKEIGIRKALGSSGTQVVMLLGKNFLKWVGISILIATPIAYYALKQWLIHFAYAIDLSWEIFLSAALLSMLVAALTISFKSYQAANINPAESLKDE